MTRTMRMTAFFLSFILLLGLTPSPGMAEPPDDSGHSFFLGPALELDVTSFVLLETRSDQLLASKNADQQIGPASLAKLMTLKLAFEALEDGTLSMDDRATVSEKAWATGGSKMYVLVGTEVTVHDLVYGIAVSSGNDAAVALAEHREGPRTRNGKHCVQDGTRVNSRGAGNDRHGYGSASEGFYRGPPGGNGDNGDPGVLLSAPRRATRHYPVQPQSAASRPGILAQQAFTWWLRLRTGRCRWSQW